MTTLTAKKISNSSRPLINTMEVVEKLAPTLLHKIKPSIGFIKKYYGKNYLDEDYDALVRGALWIAATDSDSEDAIFKKARSIIIKWIREDIQPALAEKLRQRSKNRSVPADDFFFLPWGARVSEAMINSGEKGPLSVAIEPSTTDSELLEKDTAQYLYKVLKYILEWWGPHALVWMILYTQTGCSRKAMRLMGVSDEEIEARLHQVKQADRALPRIKEDVQNKFQSTRI